MDSDTRKITLAITHYNRVDMLKRSFAQVVNDDRISEILISDDCSNKETINELLTLVPIPKVKLWYNENNLGCYKNKYEAIKKSANEWVIIFDSDNIITLDYLDKIFAYGWWDKNNIYAPSFAKPFDYRHFEGKILHRKNIARFVDSNNFSAMINTMNYFVNRDEYMKVWDHAIEPWTADSIYQNYRWLNAGNRFFVVPGLTYEHTIHDGSHYKQHNKKTGDIFNQTMNKLRAMR